MATISETITIGGMFGNDKTYFAGSPVVIDISGLVWSGSSPFNIVKVLVTDSDGETVGDFHADTGGQSEISFDIQSALRSLWADYTFESEVAAAKEALTATSVDGQTASRDMRSYSLQVVKEYLDSTDNEFSSASSDVFTGGKCMIGSLTEWERYNIGTKENADASHWQHSNFRNGDASTKPNPINCPNAMPERVGISSITSWVDVDSNGTTSVFYPSALKNGTKDKTASDTEQQHAPLVLRDSQPYVDFLFVNRRGAVETCSALTKEAMDISIDVDEYDLVERPTFKPSRSLFTIATGGRRSWEMSSGFVDRYWAAWWTQEFLMGQRHWMLLDGQFVPVTIAPSKKSVSIYDKTKQNMPHVDFTVTLALEG